MNDEFINSFLSDVEKSALQAVADNALVVNALKKVILADVYFKGTLRAGIAPDATRNSAFALAFAKPDASNESLGADVRAQSEGVRLVESGFSRLDKFKSVKTPAAAGGNKAR